jgi:hypothetical protein
MADWSFTAYCEETVCPVLQSVYASTQSTNYSDRAPAGWVLSAFYAFIAIGMAEGGLGVLASIMQIPSHSRQPLHCCFSVRLTGPYLVADSYPDIPSACCTYPFIGWLSLL